MTLEQIKRPKVEEKREEKSSINQKTKQKIDELMQEIQRRQTVDNVVIEKYTNSKNEIDAEITQRMGFKNFEEFRYEISNIIRDSKYREILKKISESFPQLADLLSKKGNPILNYYIIKQILPYLFAGGMSRKKILEIIEILLDRMIIYPNFKKFFKLFQEFLKKYSTPDGEAAKIFISSEGWK
ncbi:MAG: hypothetical protein NZ908_01470 [Candidatus Micrarchaeota archaeon]|nr:hypothetical protein [Candidatus Micrarchaeota archaeon]MCX8154705.1 hypothetical protein [Candidatus Micrarchaeota archaeon]